MTREEPRQRDDRSTDYELVDAGELRRLERFGPALVDRPAPTAVAWRRDGPAWLDSAAYRFDAGAGWRSGPASVDAGAVEPWPVAIEGLSMEARLTASGGIGLYPEHGMHIGWLESEIRARSGPDPGGDEAGAGSAGAARPVSVLNLFAHTGLLTLAAARAGAAVTHVDAARSTVAWARRNAELSALAERPVRWMVDDALAFVRREARRRRRYDGIVLDPPSFGRAGSRQWRLLDELPTLLEACRAVADADAFVLLTSHTTGVDGETLRDAMRTAFGSGSMEVLPVGLDAVSGARLDLGWAVRRTA